MIQRIIDSIAKTLHDAYPEVPILEDDVAQNLGRPAFYVRCVNSSTIDRILPGGFFLDMLFEVEYDPGDECPNYSGYEMGSQLLYLLKKIPDIEEGRAFRPYDVQSKVFDGRLLHTFYIKESVMAEPEEGTKIKVFDIDTKVKRSKYE